MRGWRSIERALPSRLPRVNSGLGADATRLERRSVRIAIHGSIDRWTPFQLRGDGTVGMSERLIVYVLNRSRKILTTHRVGGITRCPSHPRRAESLFLVDESRAGSLQTLRQPREIEARRKSHDHVDMVVHHPQGQGRRSVPTNLGGKEPLEEPCFGWAEHRHVAECLPGDVDVEHDRHADSMWTAPWRLRIIVTQERAKSCGLDRFLGALPVLCFPE